MCADRQFDLQALQQRKRWTQRCGVRLYLILGTFPSLKSTLATAMIADGACDPPTTLSIT